MEECTRLSSQNVGVDVSKDTLDVVFSTMDLKRQVKVKASRKFSNKLHGFKDFIKWIDDKSIEGFEPTILLEATGVYYEQFAWFLYERKYAVSVILPTKAKRYFQAIGNKSKNDKIDATGLSRMGLEQRIPLWQPLSKDFYRLRLLTRQLEDFNEQRTVILNQLHALSHSAYSVKEVEKNFKKLLKELDKGIVSINKSIEKLLMEDAKLRPKVEKIITIPGVGVRTIAVLLAETNGFETFENQGQLVSYSGYDIVHNQSGKYSGKTKMSKKGNAHIRRAMHLPAFGVVRCQVTPLAALYKRLTERGKTKMQAYVAVQRKLLILIWALWKKDQAYDPTYHIKNISDNEESKLLFSLVSKGDTKKIALERTRATLDELPYNESPEVLFSLL
ncbi:transposase [Owenweeksia hongkongensis DSM 17368]|uniref:Transposase n=1 Tax=Owenweeksia hongkongensis (strain DSM 17368 / CIP 108786 / JCM 12287 / NRRL B-23963 / UST20020801) TaxID=926562 RepID=G8R1E5_OWEHD|nr:IS110 family transposase [Owenweeksia hongkongensis]AEV33888.1 transposase [Owenweeksia hongkongensis DSM 17368]